MTGDRGATAFHPFHHELSAALPASPGAVFARLDDPALLGAHMAEGSAMMPGGAWGR